MQKTEEIPAVKQPEGDTAETPVRQTVEPDRGMLPRLPDEVMTDRHLRMQCDPLEKIAGHSFERTGVVLVPPQVAGAVTAPGGIYGHDSIWNLRDGIVWSHAGQGASKGARRCGHAGLVKEPADA